MTLYQTEKRSKRNVLIFHLGALGDFIVTWPLALTLARLFPQSRIFYVTHSQKGALAEKTLRIESLDIESGWHGLFAEPAALPEAATRAIGGAHTVASFLPDPTGVWAANVRKLNADANLISLATAMPPEFSGHVADFIVSQLAVWPAAQTAAGQILRSVHERGISTAPLSAGGPVVIHPGSGAARKNWQPTRFLELASQLRARGREVRVILGEVELEQWPADLLPSFESICKVVQPKTLVELHAVIAAASVFIGNDSGPSHLAGMIGKPTVALFGASSDAGRWKPLGPRVKVISAPLNEIEPAAVLAAIEAWTG